MAVKVRDILEYLNTISPLCTAESYDNVGLLAGDPDAEVKNIVTALDISCDVIDEAAANGADLIVSHHPVIFRPIKSVLAGTPVHKLIENRISAICIHTNFDMSEGGVNDALIELLGFESSGALKPLYPNGLGEGAVCDLPIGFTAKALAEHCKKTLYLESVRYCAGAQEEILRVGVCSGAGGDLLEEARSLGCQALITGDVKHNIWIDARNMGMALIDAGHYGTEKCAPHRIAALLSRRYPEILTAASERDTEPYKYV